MIATVVYKQGSIIKIDCDNINVTTDAGSNTMTLWVESNAHAEEICISMEWVEHIKFERIEDIEEL